MATIRLGDLQLLAQDPRGILDDPEVRLEFFPLLIVVLDNLVVDHFACNR
jgi:hypothetical protein